MALICDTSGVYAIYDRDDATHTATLASLIASYRYDPNLPRSFVQFGCIRVTRRRENCSAFITDGRQDGMNGINRMSWRDLYPVDPVHRVSSSVRPNPVCHHE